MRQEFFITRQGKQYVLFTGLLDEAHAKGLKGISTELIQAITVPDRARLVPGRGSGEVSVELETGGEAFRKERRGQAYQRYELNQAWHPEPAPSRGGV